RVVVKFRIHNGAAPSTHRINAAHSQLIHPNAGAGGDVSVDPSTRRTRILPIATTPANPASATNGVATSSPTVGSRLKWSAGQVSGSQLGVETRIVFHAAER